MGSTAERFWSKVEKTDGCWLWTAAVDGCGYGRFRMGRGHVGAHRMALALDGVEIPYGMQVCHTCDNPSCVRPSHLFVATQRENLADMTAKGRRQNQHTKELV